MISRVAYVFREMWASLSRNVTLTVAALITATVSLLLFGVTLLLRASFDNQLDQWSGGVELIVYVNNEATPDQVQIVKDALTAENSVVKSVSYCDIPCSIENSKRLFSGEPDTLKLLTSSKIPSFFKVVPVDRNDNDTLTQLATRFKELPQVNTVAFPGKQIDLLRSLKAFFGTRALVFSLVLLGVSVLLIWNTIRTAMFARRREIEVMKLVGATNWFIRLPFMLEGLLQGLAGGMLASGGLLYLNADWTRGVRGLPDQSGFASFVVVGSYPWTVVGIMLLVGAFVGAIGSATAASRFLDV